MLVRDIKHPTPLYIKQASDKNGEEHRFNCLAWWLITSKSKEGLEEYLRKQNAQVHSKISDRLLKAKAWIWLSTLSNEHIRRLLESENKDQSALKLHLNQLKSTYRDHFNHVSH